MCVNNLSKVALYSAAAGIEPATSSRKSNAPTTAPPSHTALHCVPKRVYECAVQWRRRRRHDAGGLGMGNCALQDVQLQPSVEESVFRRCGRPAFSAAAVFARRASLLLGAGEWRSHHQAQQADYAAGELVQSFSAGGPRNIRVHKQRHITLV